MCQNLCNNFKVFIACESYDFVNFCERTPSPFVISSASSINTHQYFTDQGRLGLLTYCTKFHFKKKNKITKATKYCIALRKQRWVICFWRMQCFWRCREDDCLNMISREHRFSLVNYEKRKWKVVEKVFMSYFKRTSLFTTEQMTTITDKFPFP